MATSGSVDFTSTRDEIIIDALTLCRAIDPEEPVGAFQIEQSARFLNRMIKTFQARGLALWMESEAILFIDKGTRIYTFPNANATDPETYNDTKTALAALTGVTAVDVDNIGNTAINDIISIMLDTGVRQWTTVVSVAGVTVTITDALLADVAIGQEVITFAKKINKPLKLLSARRTIKKIDSPLEIVSREEYVDLPNKESIGLINEVYYKPLRSTGELYVWPTGSGSDDRLSFSYQRLIEDFDLTGDNPDLPVEWHEMLVANLAHRIAPSFGVPPDVFAMVKEQAQMTYAIVDGFDNESTSAYLAMR